MTRWTILKTGASSWGCVANSKRSGIGNESTHWRTVLDHVGGGLRHVPGATARAEAAKLTEGHVPVSQRKPQAQSLGYAATTSSMTSAPAGSDVAANAVRAGNGVTPSPGSQRE